MPAFNEAGIRVFALSYDEAEALSDFRDAHNISYTLLSDPSSEVFRSLGILNTLIDPNDHPWYGIPYPGTYVLDTNGRVTHKFFENNLAVRAGSEQVLRAALNTEDGETDASRAPTESSIQSVQINVQLDSDALTPTVQKDLVINLTLPPGRHIYAAPAPEGSVAVEVVLDLDERLVQRPISYPVSETHTLSSTGETFEVHHDTVELRLPLTINSIARGVEKITLKGAVRFQVCDDAICDIPSTERFELEVAVIAAPDVALSRQQGNTLEPNAMAHFKHMSQRHRS